MANNETTTKFKVDISELVSGMQAAKRQISLANAEFKAATAGMDDWAKSADGIGAKLTQLDTTLKNQKSILGALEDQYALVAREMGEDSKEAENLKIKIENQKASIAKTEKEIRNYTSSLDELESGSEDGADAVNELSTKSKKASGNVEDLGDSAKNAESGFTVLKGAVATFVGNALTGLVSAIGNGISSLAGLGDATAEYRQGLNQLETAFGQAGMTAEETYESYNYFGSVLGDTKKAQETMLMLGQLASTQEELAGWTDTLTGVYATFGQAIPLEGLTEAVNHTVQLGEVQGTLADALEWGGISADDFNAKLATLNSEEERTQLIQQTLNDLYGEAADTYNELNKDILDASTASTNLENAMANMGDVVRPLNTVFTEFKAGLINELVPSLTTVKDGLLAMASGTEGAGDQVAQGIQQLVTDVIGKVTTLLPQFLQVGTQLVTSLVTGLITALPSVLEAIIGIAPQLISSLLGMLPLLVSTAATLISQLLSALGTLLPQIVMEVIEIVPQIIDALVAAIPELINGAIQFLLAIVEAIPTVIEDLVGAIPQIIDSLINGLISGVGALIEGAITLLMAIVEAIPQIIPPLVAALPKIINSLIQGLMTYFPVVINGAIQLLMAIISAIPQIIPPLVAALPQIIESILTALVENIPLMLETAISLFMALVEAIPTVIVELGKAIPDIITSILEALASLPELLGEFFVGVWEGIKEVFAPFADFFGEKSEESTNGIKEFFGGIATWFDENVITPVVEFFTGLWESVSGIFTDLWNDITAIFAPAIEWFTELFNSVWSTLSSVIQVILTLLRGCWMIIKHIFGVVAGWFDENVIGPVSDFFSDMWELISDKASEAWGFIVGVFEKVSGWFEDNIITPVSDFFSDMWDKVSSGASDAWDGIKEVFSKVAGFFQETFEEAWNKVKNVFSVGGEIFGGIVDGIVESFTNIVNTIIRGINDVVAVPFNAINDALNTIKNVSIAGMEPFSGLPNITVPVIPELYKGGVLRKGQMGFLEGNGDEAVVPLDHNTGWLDEVASRIVDKGGMAGGQPQTVNNNYNYEYNQTNNSPKALSRLEIYRQTRNQFNYAVGGSV